MIRQPFICPHCHAAVDPGAMEVALSDVAEYRVCPGCDELVFLALRKAPLVPAWLRRSEGARSRTTARETNARAGS